MPYQVLLVDLLTFVVILVVAEGLARLVARRRRAPDATGVVDQQLSGSLRRLVRAGVIVGLSLGFASVEELLIHALSISPDAHHLAALEVQHLEAWLIFWAVDVVINGADFALRTRAHRKGRVLGVSPLVAGIARVLLMALTGLWITRYVLDWHTTHVLVSATALTAVAAFALKGVTSDLLGGLALHLTRSVLPAHWIDVPSLKVSGEIISAGWRAVRLRTTSGHILIVPNSKLAGAVIHNMSWPEPLRRHGLDFDLSVEADPDVVEEALLAAADGMPGVLTEPKPPQVIIRRHVQWGTRYQLRVWSNTYHNRSSFESRIYRAAWRELRARDIRFITLSATVSHPGAGDEAEV